MASNYNITDAITGGVRLLLTMLSHILLRKLRPRQALQSLDDRLEQYNRLLERLPRGGQLRGDLEAVCESHLR